MQALQEHFMCGVHFVIHVILHCLGYLCMLCVCVMLCVCCACVCCVCVVRVCLRMCVCVFNNS